MDKINLAKLFEKQISLTEWFGQMNHADAEDLRVEDNEKRERLKILHQLIGLPFDEPIQFSAMDLQTCTPEFQKFLTERGDELCALRLIPLDKHLPKLRMRGLSISRVLDWFTEQNIDPAQYRADFIPHSDNQTWSTIFLVNKQGIFGEIIKGRHHQLTQGFHDEGKPITFTYDFITLSLSEENLEARKEIESILLHLKVDNTDLQKELGVKLDAKFANDYLVGYFETVSSMEFGLWFIDYNRILGKIYENMPLPNIEKIENGSLRGQSANAGIAKGKVRVVDVSDALKKNFTSDDVLVCIMTTPDYLPLMQACAAIVTDLGGILSHAAIISRELNKPCVIGTGNATKILKDGDMVEVDANKGIVKLI